MASLLCSECIVKNGRKPCPICRTCSPRFFNDNKCKSTRPRNSNFFSCLVYSMPDRREIKQLQVRCANSEKGCQWIGTVGTLDDHLASCQFALVPCPNKCGKNKGAGAFLLIRKKLDELLKTKCPRRTYKCPCCGEKGTLASIKQD